MNVSELINEILSEWAYRVDDGMPNPKNPTHLKELGIVLSEMGLSHIKKDLVESLLTEKGKTPEKVKEAEEGNFSNPVLNKKVTYKSASGEDKEGIVGNLLRQPKGTPARDAAEKVLPPEGSPEREELNKELGGEGQPKGEKEPGAEKGAGEDEKMKQAAAMFDPKSDPAMAARLDKEKEVQAQLAADADAQKADFKAQADKAQDDFTTQAAAEKERKAKEKQDGEKTQPEKPKKVDKNTALNAEADEVENIGPSELHKGKFHVGGGYYADKEGDTPTTKLIGDKLVPISDNRREMLKSGLFDPRLLGRADKVVKDNGKDLEKLMNDPEIQSKTKEALKKYIDLELSNKKKKPSEPAKREPANDDPESKAQQFKGKSSGENIQTMEMEGGGFVYGTKHGNTAMVDDILDDVKSKIPKERWKDVVFVGEGGATNNAGELEFNDEMDYAAPKFKEMGAGVDTWDGDDMDVHNDQSKLYQKQKEKTGLNDSQVKAGNWASMIGQGEGTDTMSPNDFLDDEGKQFLQDAAKEAGFPPIENWDEPTEQDKDTLYRLSFPEDNGDKPTKINDIQVAFNEIRDENLIEKNKELTAQGKIPITIAGESHVDLVDKMSRKGEQPSTTKPAEPSAEKPAEPSAEPETPTGVQPKSATPAKLDKNIPQTPAGVQPKSATPAKLDKNIPQTPPGVQPKSATPAKLDKDIPQKPTGVQPKSATPAKLDKDISQDKKDDKEAIKKEKPGQEATSSSGQKIYSLGGGYYSDKPNGKARYVRTEWVVDLAFSDIITEDVFALFEKTISATLSNGKTIKVQELPPRAQKKATQKARKAAAAYKEPEAKPPVIAPPGVKPKAPTDAAPPIGTKVGAVPPPPPPPPPTAKKADEPKDDTKFNPIPPQDVQAQIPQADPDTFGGQSDIPDGIDKQDLEKFNTDISKVQQMVADAKAKGEKAPDINLCQITVPGTNLYCDDNLGIPRDQMPQFKGKPVPGSKAEKMPLNKDGEVDTEPVFREMLKEKGIKTTQTEVPADKLKATQSELGGDKVVGMMGALEKDPNHPGITGPIYVSRDGFVIDGHHRWAAIAAYNAKYPDKQIPMKCEVIDMDIKDAIPMCNKFAEDIGIAAKKQGETTGKAGEEPPKGETPPPGTKKAGAVPPPPPPAPPTKVSSIKNFTDKIKQKISKWSEGEKEYFKNGYHKPGSEARRTIGQTLKDKASGAWKAVKDGFKHEVHEFKTAGKAVGKLFSEAGGWNDLSHHEKDALKAVGIKIVTTALFGAAFGGLAHGGVAFAKHVAIEFVPHVVAETFLKGAGRAALFADAEGEAEMDAKFVKFAEMIADGLENMKISPEQMDAMIDSYNKKKEEGSIKVETSIIDAIILEILNEAKPGESKQFPGYYHRGHGYYSTQPDGEISHKSQDGAIKKLTAKEKAEKNAGKTTKQVGKTLGVGDFRDTGEKDIEEPTQTSSDNSIPSVVSNGLNKGSLDSLKSVNAKLVSDRDKGIAGAGGPVASYGEAALTTFANTLQSVGGFEGYVIENGPAIEKKVGIIRKNQKAFKNSIETVARQLGFVLPKDENKVIEYIAARMVFGDNELERLKKDKNSLWYKTGKQGFSQDEDAFRAWSRADFDGAISTRTLIQEQSKIDTSKEYIVIQSDPKKGGHDEGILNHLNAKLEEAKAKGDKEAIQHYESEIYAFTKLGFHDTMVVGFDKKGRTTVLSITNKKQDDLQDIWGNTTPEYALNLIKNSFGPKVSKTVVDVIEDGIVKVSNSKKATTTLFSTMKLNDDFVAICDTPEMKKYMNQLKGHKKFNAWLSENNFKPKTTKEWLVLGQKYVKENEDAPYEPFGKFVHKVGELSQVGPFVRKHPEINFASSAVKKAVQTKNDEKELTAAVHRDVVDSISEADKKAGFPKKDGKNGPHTQAYLTTVMHSMHFDLMVENFDGNLGAITGIRGSVPSDFRECLAKLSGFKGDVKSKEGRDSLNRHLLERCKLNPQTRAIEITNEEGTTVLAEDTWRTAGTSQKVEKKLGGGLRNCISARVDKRQAVKRAKGK